MKKILITIATVIVLIVITVIVVKSITGKKVEQEEIVPTPTIALPTISDKISVGLKPQSDNKYVVLTVNGLTPDIESVEYELTYVTGNNLPRGVLGKIRLSGEKNITRDNIVLGTCSSGKCVYDSGVTSVNLSLKFNSATGSQIFQKTYSL